MKAPQTAFMTLSLNAPDNLSQKIKNEKSLFTQCLPVYGAFPVRQRVFLRDQCGVSS